MLRERGDVLMLPNGELVVYDATAHAVRREEPSGFAAPSYLRHEDLEACGRAVGTIERFAAGLVALFSIQAFQVGEKRFLICHKDTVKAARVFHTVEEAQQWIDDSTYAPSRFHVVAVTVEKATPRPWDPYPEVAPP